MKERKRMTIMSFRLDDKQIAIIDRWAAGISKNVGRDVTRSEAVRFIIEGFLRAEQGLPEIGDEALLNLIASYPE